MVPGSEWKGKAEANSRPESRDSGDGSEWGGFPTSLSPWQGGPPTRAGPQQGHTRTPADLHVAAPVATGLTEQDTRHPKPGSWAQSAPPWDFP